MCRASSPYAASPEPDAGGGAWAGPWRHATARAKSAGTTARHRIDRERTVMASGYLKHAITARPELVEVQPRRSWFDELTTSGAWASDPSGCYRTARAGLVRSCAPHADSSRALRPRRLVLRARRGGAASAAARASRARHPELPH